MISIDDLGARMLGFQSSGEALSVLAGELFADPLSRQDNPDAPESLRLMLELDRHQVAVASSAEEGLVRARAWHPDVVLSDVGLPGVSGYELARALRADSPTKPHLVAITGYGQTENRERALRSGFERHVTKPFDHATLHRPRHPESEAAPLDEPPPDGARTSPLLLSHPASAGFVSVAGSL